MAEVRMKYREYKSLTGNIKTVKDSYNAEDKTIVVIISDLVAEAEKIVPEGFYDNMTHWQNVLETVRYFQVANANGIELEGDVPEWSTKLMQMVKEDKR